MDFTKAANHVKKFEGQLIVQIDKGMDDITNAGLVIAKRRSSGTRTYAEMRKADHPYARRHGSPLWDASIVNNHTGGFYAGWFGRRTQYGRSIVNESPEAEFMGGTRFMFRRPIDDATEADLAEDADEIMRRRLWQRFM